MDKIASNPSEVYTYVEILNNQLYFAVIKGKYTTKLKSTMDTFFFSTDEDFIYENYYCDFGPLNISCLYKYCCKLKKYLQYAKGLKRVVHYTTNYPEKKANAACLMGLFCIIYLKLHPKEVWKILQDVGPYKPFVDASQCPCGFTLKILDCLYSVSKAFTFNFFDFDDFNVAEYDLHDKLQYGDMNWLIPRKFLAFIGPADNRTAHPPEFYIKYFLKNDIKTVIRLNTIIYDSSVFTQVGIVHYDLIFPDGTTPPKDILLKFLNISETAQAAIAVHCKAGLGRTGSLIGAYLIKHYHMTAKEAIGWMRVCRPGSVIGQQQIWLEKLESWLWRLGNQYRAAKYGDSDKIPRHKYGIYSKIWPRDREKLIHETRKRIQKTFTKSQLEKLSKHKKLVTSLDSLPKKKKQDKLYKKCNTDISTATSVSKILTSLQGTDSLSTSEKIRILSVDPLRRNCLYSNSSVSNQSRDLYYSSLRSLTGTIDSFESIAHRNSHGVMNWQSTLDKSTKENIGNLATQGDKLNEIKSSRYSKIMSKTSFPNSKYLLKDSKTFTPQKI